MQKVHFRLTSVAQKRCCLSSLMMWYERCTGIVEVKGSNTVQAWFFFQAFFSQLQKQDLSEEISLWIKFNVGWLLNPTKIPQFEHAACISENFLHGCYENLLHPWVSWKLRPFNIFQILQLTIDRQQPLSVFPIYRSEISFCINIAWAKVRTGKISTKPNFSDGL